MLGASRGLLQTFEQLLRPECLEDRAVAGYFHGNPNTSMQDNYAANFINMGC